LNAGDAAAAAPGIPELSMRIKMKQCASPNIFVFRFLLSPKAIYIE
jgi:hypothetical protein